MSLRSHRRGLPRVPVAPSRSGKGGPPADGPSAGPRRRGPRPAAPPRRPDALQEGRFFGPPRAGADRRRRPDRRRFQRGRRAQPEDEPRAVPPLPARRQGGPDQRARVPRGRPGLLGGLGPFRQQPDDGPGASHGRHRARHRRRGQGRSVADDGPRERRPSAAGRIPPDRPHGQHDGPPARLLRLGGHARGPRGRHGRQARRPGQGQGRRRHLEGPDREREPDGRQSDRPGAQHRRRHDGRGERRPGEEDHGRRQGRVPRAEGHDQHDGGSAPLLRFGSHARGARGRHGRQARRPGARRGRLGDVERPDGQRQFHGRQPDVAGPQHRRRDQGRRSGRPVQEDHGRRRGRDPRAEEHRQHDGRPALLLRGRSHARRPRGRHRRQARRSGRRARRRRHAGRTSRTTSTSWPAT